MVTGLDNDACVNIDMFITPEEAERTKRMIKELAVMTGRYPLRSNNDPGAYKDPASSTESISQIIPFGAIHLLEKDACYEFETMNAIDDQRLSPTMTFDLQDAHSTAVDMGQRYIEALILFGPYWFLVTSMDVFLHGRPTIDDEEYYGHPPITHLEHPLFPGQFSLIIK